jgi:hypothetical protein
MVLSNIHKHVEGVPKLVPPPLFRCDTCLRTKATKRAITAAEVHAKLKQSDMPSDDPYTQPNPEAATNPETMDAGAHFHMDMGFVRGMKFSSRDEDGRLITSLDGYNSYILIIDRATRYTWVILTKSKIPQIDMLRKFLNMHGSKSAAQRYIRTDQGGELWRSHLFQQMCKDLNFIPQPTASDASFQNGMAERPNQTFGDMMRSMLHGANLGPEYWSWALLHAVYVKNRLPHRALGITPYQAYTGRKPDIRHLRIFGSPVVSRLPGRRLAKLDSHTSGGIFLGFTATSRNIYYRDSKTKRFKIATHVTFDEAGYTIPGSQLTPIQRTLQRCGHEQDQHCTTSIPEEIPSNTNVLQVQLLTPQATLPTRGTPDSAGLDLYSATQVDLPPGVPTAVPTDIAVCPPLGTYCQVLSRSGLMLHHQVEVKAGVIDQDYTGNVKIVL